MLGLYLGIAIVANLFLGRSWLFRRFSGDRDLDEKPARRTTEQRYVDTIAKVGTGLPPDQLYGRRTFRTTWGLRLVSLALSSVLIFMLGHGVLVDILGGRAWNGAYFLLIAVAAYIYFNFYIFTYEVVLFDGKLINRGYLLTKQRFELRKLKEIQHNPGGYYRLRFANGKTTYVLQHVQGHNALIETLKDAVEQDTYDICPSFPR
ncbi:hypothetical protein [Shimia sp. SDUM112013]|uniref:hypothetical protein n=1 Tax=Shimia sp. SDUM112013 TaxID=3136160 RepID=UPI0032EC3F6C